jgi:hypothetical protein
LAIKWNIKSPEDWNKVTKEMILKEGGNFIKHSYNSSLKKGTEMEIIKEATVE